MEVVATTKDGVLIQATTKEVSEILRSVTGEYPKELKIGQKIPAIDYSTSITKIKALNQSSAFTYLQSRVVEFNNEFGKLVSSVETCANISIE